MNWKGLFVKVWKFVDFIFELLSVKEEIYGVLDVFVVWELEFFIVVIKKVL